MLTTSATQNNADAPFPFSPSREEETVLHPSTTAKRVAKGMEKLKKPLPTGSRGTGLQILQKMAAGLPIDHIAEDVAIEDDSWLNSNPQDSQEHLEPPDWLEVLLQELREMPIKEPPEIDKGQLQKVKEGLDKLKEEAEKTLKNSEHSLLDTGTVEILMTPQAPSQGEEAADSSMQAELTEPAISDTEGYNEAIEATPTECIPVVRVSTPPLPVQEKPVVLDPVTPIPDILAPESNPEAAAVTQIKPPPTFRQSDSIKLKETHHQATGANPLNEMYSFIINHERENQIHPECIQVSTIFNKILEDDVWKVKRTIFGGYLPYVGSTGIVYIEVIPVPKLKLSPKRVICISKG